MANAAFALNGFLPHSDPLKRFPDNSEFSFLDELGGDLPSLLLEKDCRNYLESLSLPMPSDQWQPDTHSPEMHLYYVRLGFIASGYINQVNCPKAHSLPGNLARPLVGIAKKLNRPPILSYDGYALYNWKRFDTDKAIALGNIDTLQNFVHLYDEHWFILIHVEIEALAAELIRSIADLSHLNPSAPSKVQPKTQTSAAAGEGERCPAIWETAVNQTLSILSVTLEKQLAVLKRIPERMSPDLYFQTFRPYIRFFENVVYEDCDVKEVNFRGETGAQSSLMPLLTAFLKIPHQPSELTNHLEEMKLYMPLSHRQLIEAVSKMPPVKDVADKRLFNKVLETMALFREVHYGWAEKYINAKVSDPRGTGGTPYMKWLHQLIAETRSHKMI